VYRSRRADSQVETHLVRAASDVVWTGDSSSSRHASFDDKPDRRSVDAASLPQPSPHNTLAVPARE